MSHCTISQISLLSLRTLATALCLLPAAALSAPASFLAAGEPPVVVDLRPREAFEQCHLSGSSSLPLTSLRARLFELPPPGEWPLTLVGSAAELETARALLLPKGWEFEERHADDSAFWEGAASESGPDSAPLLRPNAFLASALRQVDLPEAGAAIDVGCGSGRDAVFLAQTLGDTWETIGVDNHKGALERAQRLADGCGVSVAFALANVRKQSLSDLTERPISLVHGCRFLDRPLLRALPEVIAPGGLVVWSTFLDGELPPQAKPPEPSVSPRAQARSRRPRFARRRRLFDPAAGCSEARWSTSLGSRAASRCCARRRARFSRGACGRAPPFSSREGLDDPRGRKRLVRRVIFLPFAVAADGRRRSRSINNTRFAPFVTLDRRGQGACASIVSASGVSDV